MRFYTGDMFPDYYKNGIFIAEHGSWNRSEKIGYRVSFIKIRDNKAVSYEIFASGWLYNGSVSGRPADVQTGPDGALYVSDDKADVIYRIYYDK
jgi:glucose/arabinose dehydrogenase